MIAPANSRLHQYLRRINYGGPLSPSRQTLYGLHRAHLLAIPFENVDVQLRVRPTLDIDAIFQKIVVRERGGWCYEMNALFGSILRELGFRLDYVAAAVNRQRSGERAFMNHLAMIVHVENGYLADVGFGNGTLAPLPLREGTFNDSRFEFRLTKHGEWWRFHNHRHNGATYDFTERPYELADFEVKMRMLASTAESPFVQHLVVGQLTEDGMITLTNAALQVHRAKELSEETAPSAKELQRILREHFRLEVEEIESLWNRVSSQHKHWVRKKVRGF
jgi:N-hydroxyarylamine O-acetyltransferase